MVQDMVHNKRNSKKETNKPEKLRYLGINLQFCLVKSGKIRKHADSVHAGKLNG